MKIFANSINFKRTRILKGLTQRELAKLSGLSHTYISLIESTGKSVGPATAKKLSAILEKELEELFIIE